MQSQDAQIVQSMCVLQNAEVFDFGYKHPVKTLVGSDFEPTSESELPFTKKHGGECWRPVPAGIMKRS